MQVRLCDSSQDAVKTDASPSATCAIVTSESLAEINANFFPDDDKPGLPIRMENPDPDHHPRLPQSHTDLEPPESPFSQVNYSNHRQSPDLPVIHSPPHSVLVNPESMLHVPVISIAPTGLHINRSIFAGASAMPQCKSSLASLVSAASISLKHEQELANEGTAAAAAAILLFKGETSEAANLILGLPLPDPHGTDPIAFVCAEDELASAASDSKCPSPFPAHVVHAMDPSSGSLEYDSNPPPSSAGSNNSSATDVGVSVALTGTLASSAPAISTGRRAGNGGASAGGNGPDLPDTKEGIEELCPVCGDKVSGYHYGLLTCESCKGFFKRTVQNKKVYTCVADRSCHIDKSQRKRCPFCRFQKCLEVGMKLEAVRADRMRGGRNKFGPMYKRDRARKLQTIREKQMRPSASGTPSSQSSSGGTPSQTAMYATDATLYTVGGPTSTGNNPLPLYVTGGGIKHEIQIPQVSSLTSSPDSSPSPLGLPGASYANHGTSNHGGMGGASNGGQTHEKQLWNNNNNNNNNNSHNPGSGTNVPSSHATTPSPPHPQHPHLSPKQFQFEGLLGNSVGTSSSTNMGAGLTGTGTGTGTGTTPTAKMPPLVREFVQSLDDKEWQSALFGLLQSQSYNQVEVDLFELLCKVLDQNLFSQVDWARNSVFFKDLRVDDQMKMLQHSWSDLLILDHIHQRLHNHLPDETTLPNGQKFELVSLAMLGASELAEPLHDLTRRLQEIRFDVPDYICLKFLLLLNPDVRGLLNRRHVVEAHDQVQQALFDYTLNCYPQVPDKFSKLLAILPDVHSISSRGEDFLYFKHLNGFAPTQTLLMEMLHAKRR